MQTAVMKAWSPVLGLYDFMTDWDDVESKKRIVLQPLTPEEIEDWRSKGKSVHESSDTDNKNDTKIDDVVVDNASEHSEAEPEPVSEPEVPKKKRSRKKRRGRKPVKPAVSSDSDSD